MEATAAADSRGTNDLYLFFFTVGLCALLPFFDENGRWTFEELCNMYFLTLNNDYTGYIIFTTIDTNANVVSIPYEVIVKVAFKANFIKLMLFLFSRVCSRFEVF